MSRVDNEKMSRFWREQQRERIRSNSKMPRITDSYVVPAIKPDQNRGSGINMKMITGGRQAMNKKTNTGAPPRGSQMAPMVGSTPLLGGYAKLGPNWKKTVGGGRVGS